VTTSVNAIFVPPVASSYGASKAAIAKAFDGLRLAHVKNNLKFVNIFCGPVKTEGFLGKIAFMWTPERMAKYMVKKALRGTRRAYPSWIYTKASKLLNHLPTKLVLKMLKGYNE